MPFVSCPSWPASLPLVAILRGIQPHEAVAHAVALLDVGFDCIEVPTNSPNWTASVGAIATHAGDNALVGAGTVLENSHLEALRSAGGRMAVSPHTDPGLITAAVHQGFIAIPGAMTASEILAAAHVGAQAVKLFPASSLGLAHVRALRAVLPPQLPILAVGGIHLENLSDYLRAGCACAGLGTDLYRPGQLAEWSATGRPRSWKASTVFARSGSTLSR